MSRISSSGSPVPFQPPAVSGVYYSVDVLPGWLQAVSYLSPATYMLDGIRFGKRV